MEKQTGFSKSFEVLFAAFKVVVQTPDDINSELQSLCWSQKELDLEGLGEGNSHQDQMQPRNFGWKR